MGSSAWEPLAGRADAVDLKRLSGRGVALGVSLAVAGFLRARR